MVTFRLCSTEASKKKKYPVLLPKTSFPARVEGEKRVKLDEQVRLLHLSAGCPICSNIWVGLNFIWLFYHLSWLLRRFCQFFISLVLIGQSMEHSFKSTEPRSTSRWDTLCYLIDSLRNNIPHLTDHLLREIFHAVLLAAEEAEGEGRVCPARRPALRQRSRAHGSRRQQGHQGHHQQVRQERENIFLGCNTKDTKCRVSNLVWIHKDFKTQVIPTQVHQT